MSSPAKKQSSAESSNRRTSSSPSVGSAMSKKGSQSKSKGGTASNTKNRKTRSKQTKDSSLPRAGAGPYTAPPSFDFDFDFDILHPDPEIYEYYERMTDIEHDVKKMLLRSRLEKLIECQQMIEKEIGDLEKDFARDFDIGAHSTTRPRRDIHVESDSSLKSKQFRVVGGSSGNLSYEIVKKPDKDGKVRAFSLEVDVKGYMSDKVEIDTEDAVMVIKAYRVNGSSRDLKVVAPTTDDMEKAYIHPPRFGLLAIDF